MGARAEGGRLTGSGHRDKINDRYAKRSGDPAVELLLLSARRSLNPRQGNRVADLVQNAVIVDQALTWARRHRLIPLFCRNVLAKAGGNLANESHERLATLLGQTNLRGLAHTAELIRVVRAFEVEGLEVLVVKGPALAHEIFGDPALRFGRDLDLLVRPTQVGPALDCFRALGYEFKLPERFRLESRLGSLFLRRGAGQFELEKQNPNVLVELHWKLAHPEAELPLEEEDVWARPRSIDLGGQAVRTLPQDALMVYLCYHGSKHRWRRLHWLVDVAELMRSASEAAWLDAVTLADRLGVGPALGLTAALAEDILEAPVPPALRERAGWLVRGRVLANGLLPALFDSKVDGVRFESVRDRQTWALALQTKSSHRLRPGFWLWPLAPTVDDLARFRLPDFLAPLIYAQRLLKGRRAQN